MRASDRFFEFSPLWLRTLLLNAHATRLARFREGAPLQEKIRIIDELDRAERSVVARYQLEQINALLAWAGDRVPYYRGAWTGGAPRLGSFDDLRLLPELTKGTVREAGRTLHADGVVNYSGHTSGTTGTPLHLVYDREQRVWNRAAERLVRIRAGLRIEDPVAVVWGRKVVPPNRKGPPYWLRNAADNELWLSAFHLASETVSQYLDAIRGFGAVALETYPSIAYVLAVLARDRNVKLRLARVLTTSETLHPFQRALIEEVFGTEVFDYYGAAERVAFAIECGRHDGLHLLEAFGYVEPAAGSSGFVATGLTNRAMPLIRYRVEDATEVIEAPCPCGLTSRRLSPVTTKAEDLLVAPDGRLVSPSILTHAFKPLVGLVRSQLVQEAIDRVDVYLETGPEWDQRQEASIVASLSERMGPGVRIEVHRVDRLEQTSAGKFRWVVCKVPQRDRPAQLRQSGAER
jgi:phenylacetate-CoA ligase